MRGLALVVAAPSPLQVTALHALLTGVAIWRWTERVAALRPDPPSDSVHVTDTEVEAWLVLPIGFVIVTVGAMLSSVKVIAAPVKVLPTLSVAVACTV